MKSPNAPRPGLLQFGKEAPQMLFDLLGIKTTGIIKEAAKRALALPGVMAGAAATFGGDFQHRRMLWFLSWLLLLRHECVLLKLLL